MPIYGGPSKSNPQEVNIIPFEHLTAGIAAASANAAYFVKVVVDAPRTIGALSFFVSVTSGNVDVGIYTFDGTTMTRLTSAGSTAAGITNTTQKIAFTAQTLRPGTTYYFAFAVDNATATFGRLGSGAANFGAMGNSVLLKTSSFPLPATVSTPSGSTYTPVLMGSPS